MKNAGRRLGILSAAMALCLLAQSPRYASAAACPPLTCGTVVSGSCSVSCLFESMHQVGTCTAAGSTHNLYVVKCQCLQTECYE
jgi:hypothetical protein